MSNFSLRVTANVDYAFGANVYAFALETPAPSTADIKEFAKTHGPPGVIEMTRVNDQNNVYIAPRDRLVHDVEMECTLTHIYEDITATSVSQNATTSSTYKVYVVAVVNRDISYNTNGNIPTKIGTITPYKPGFLSKLQVNVSDIYILKNVVRYGQIVAMTKFFIFLLRRSSTYNMNQVIQNMLQYDPYYNDDVIDSPFIKTGLLEHDVLYIPSVIFNKAFFDSNKFVDKNTQILFEGFAYPPTFSPTTVGIYDLHILIAKDIHTYILYVHPEEINHFSYAAPSHVSYAHATNNSGGAPSTLPSYFDSKGVGLVSYPLYGPGVSFFARNNDSELFSIFLVYNVKNLSTGHFTYTSVVFIEKNISIKFIKTSHADGRDIFKIELYLNETLFSGNIIIGNDVAQLIEDGEMYLLLPFTNDSVFMYIKTANYERRFYLPFGEPLPANLTYQHGSSTDDVDTGVYLYYMFCIPVYVDMNMLYTDENRETIKKFINQYHNVSL